MSNCSVCPLRSCRGRLDRLAEVAAMDVVPDAVAAAAGPLAAALVAGLAEELAAEWQEPCWWSCSPHLLCDSSIAAGPLTKMSPNSLHQRCNHNLSNRRTDTSARAKAGASSEGRMS